VGALGALEKDKKPVKEQMIAFLELAERKMTGQSNAAVLEKAREELVALYLDTSQFEKASQCQGRLRESAATAERKEEFTQDLLQTYLSWKKPDLVAKLLGEALQSSDLDPNSVLVKKVDAHMSKPPEGTDPNGVYEALAALKVPPERPKWQQWLKAWAVRLAGAKATDKPTGVGKPEEG
jgi:hypothetical protein